MKKLITILILTVTMSMNAQMYNESYGTIDYMTVNVFSDTEGSFGLGIRGVKDNFYSGIDVENLYKPGNRLYFNAIGRVGYFLPVNDFFITLGGRVGMQNINWQFRRISVGLETGLEYLINDKIFIGTKFSKDFCAPYLDDQKRAVYAMPNKLLFSIGIKI